MQDSSRFPHLAHSRSNPKRALHFTQQYSRPKEKENLDMESQYHRSNSHAVSRPSALPASTASALGSSSTGMSTAKARQYAQLHSQLAQLNNNLAETENLVRMTAVQAGDMRFLGGYIGSLFMGAAKVLGEETGKKRRW